MLVSKCFALSFSIVLFSATISFSQSKKDIKKLNIRSVTETTTNISQGKESTFTESVEKFDKDGNVIELTEFNKDGSFKKKESKKYNKAGKIIEEVQYSEKGNVLSKSVYTFNENNDKLSEQTIDASGKITEWIKYGYNSLNERISENHFDEKGKLVKKSTISYDKNGLKKEKRTYSPSDELISVKKYTYKTVASDE